MPPKKIKLEEEDHSTQEVLKEDPLDHPTREVLFKVKDRMDEKNKLCPLPGGKKHTSIIITRDIDEANKVEKFCSEELEKKAVVVHSKAIKGKKRAIAERYKNDKYEMIVIVGMLLEGFDHPPLSITGIVTKIVSTVRFAQFVGRIQRLVRHKREDGTIEVEENIKGDITSISSRRSAMLIILIQEENKQLYTDCAKPGAEDITAGAEQ